MIPAEAKRVALRPLAFGEVTGHNHRLVSTGSVAVEDACELYETEGPDKTGYLRVTAEGISLIHADGDSLKTADHQPHVVPPGDYKVTIQTETTDWGQQRVAD